MYAVYRYQSRNESNSLFIFVYVKQDTSTRLENAAAPRKRPSARTAKRPSAARLTS